jgi:hypothetical protein
MAEAKEMVDDYQAPSSPRIIMIQDSFSQSDDRNEEIFDKQEIPLPPGLASQIGQPTLSIQVRQLVIPRQIDEKEMEKSGNDVSGSSSGENGKYDKDDETSAPSSNPDVPSSSSGNSTRAVSSRRKPTRGAVPFEQRCARCVKQRRACNGSFPCNKCLERSKEVAMNCRPLQ